MTKKRRKCIGQPNRKIMGEVAFAVALIQQSSFSMLRRSLVDVDDLVDDTPEIFSV